MGEISVYITRSEHAETVTVYVQVTRLRARVWQVMLACIACMWECRQPMQQYCVCSPVLLTIYQGISTFVDLLFRIRQC